MLYHLLLLVLIIPPLKAHTLKEAFEAARKNMETIKRAELGVTQREEQKSRAVAAVLPTINGFGTYTRIDPPQIQGLNAFTLTKQYNFGLRLTQPIIRGGVIGALNVASENILLSQFQRDATDLNLYQLVIDAYYSLKGAQLDVENLKSFLTFTKERVKEIRERTIIGRSRKGELIEAEAQLHAADSQYQLGLITLEQRQKYFEFLTNLPADKISDLPALPEVRGEAEVYLGKIEDRPDIKANKQQIVVSDYQIQVSKGGHWPSVDLIGNYYFDRTGVLASSEWDIGVAVTFPLYQGGGVSAGVREAVATKRIAELTSNETVRTARREVSVLYKNYLQIQEQLKSQKMALIKSEEAYKVNKNDYRYGLVTNLDVLVSLSNFIQNKRSYDSLYAAAHRAYKDLEAATGVLP